MYNRAMINVTAPLFKLSNNSTLVYCNLRQFISWSKNKTFIPLLDIKICSWVFLDCE